MKKVLKPQYIAAAIALAVVSQQANATNGYASHGFGTIQKAMGGTAVAGHDNAMNAATNPAAMSFGENNWTGGLDLFRPDRGSSHSGAFDPASGAATGPAETFDGNGDEYFPIPEFGYQRRLNDKYTFGVAVYGNGGMNATYSQSIFGAGPTSSNTGIDFAQLFIAPSVSMKINEKNSIGASLNLAYQRIEVTGVDGFGVFSRDGSKLSDNGYDSATGAGFTLGWQGQVTPKVKVGLAYRSETKMSEFDDYRGLLAEQGDFDIPSMITGGLSIQATPKTTIAIDVARINYTDVKAISNLNNTAPLQGVVQSVLGGGGSIQDAAIALQTGTNPLLGDDEGAGFGWDDQNIVKLGIKHQLNNKLTLLGGYNHGKAPIPSSETAFNVLAPATVEDHLTLGVDWKLSNNSNVTVQYMHAFENEIKGTLVPGSIIPRPTGAAVADLKMKQDSIGVAYTKKF